MPINKFVVFVWTLLCFSILTGCNPAQGNHRGEAGDSAQDRPQVAQLSSTTGLTPGTTFFSDIAEVNSDTYLATITGEGRVFRLTRSDSKWHVLDSFPGSDWPLNSISMLDGRKGFVIGNGGTMLRTADGGATWSEIARFTDLNLTKLQFANSSTGYVTAELGVVGESNAISYSLEVFRTSDGGATWKSVYSHQSLGGPVLEIAIQSASGASLLAGNKLISTLDGGNSWSEVVPSELITGLTLTRDGLGWAVNNRGDLLRTGDYGRSWQASEVAGVLSECKWITVDFHDGLGIAVSRDGCVAYTRDGTNWKAVQERIVEPLTSAFSTKRGALIIGERTIYELTF